MSISNAFTAGVLIAVASTATACGGGSTSDDPYRFAASGLCEASARAAEGDFDGAEDEFYDTVHQPLHELAAELSGVDREIAARLLEAKEAVESGLDGSGSGLGDAFGVLVAATDEALTATGYDPISCTSGGDS